MSAMEHSETPKTYTTIYIQPQSIGHVKNEIFLPIYEILAACGCSQLAAGVLVSVKMSIYELC